MRLEQQLIDRCTMSVAEFKSYGTNIKTPNNAGQLIHVDNGSNILGVAHLDYVLWKKPKLRKSKIYCPQLDDRLGAWVLLDLLPSMGCVPFDVLLTDDEEMGQSTGQYFEPPRQYNWIFSFDREGTGVVLYDYEDDDTSSMIKNYDFIIEQGSFSDISFMELSCKGFNFGTGYHNQHTKMCYADLDHTVDNACKFTTFAACEKDTKMPHDHSTDFGHWYNYRDYTHSEHYYKDVNRNLVSCEKNDDICDACLNEIESIWLYCPYCGESTYEHA